MRKKPWHTAAILAATLALAAQCTVEVAIATGAATVRHDQRDVIAVREPTVSVVVAGE